MLFSNAIGVYFREHRVDIHVVQRQLKGYRSLGNLALEGLEGKDPILLRAEVATFLDKVNARFGSVGVCLSPSQVLFRHLSLPAEVEENLDQAIQLQLVNQVPTDPEDYYVQKVVTTDSERNTVEVDLYLAPIEQVRKTVAFLKNLGLPPKYLTMDFFALERLLAGRRDLHQKSVFIADIRQGELGISHFTRGRFVSYAVQALPADPDFSVVERAVEVCASEARLPEEAEIEVFVNVVNPDWIHAVAGANPLYVKSIWDLCHFEPRPEGDALPAVVALLGESGRKPRINLIPSRWEGKPTKVGLVPTIVFCGALALIGGLNFTREGLQIEEANQRLDQQIAQKDREYRKVTGLHKRIVDERKSFDALQSIVKKPMSDITILKELTEKVGPKTYITEYVRADTLMISGLTDNVLDLLSKLSTIKMFKSINMEGSIMKTREGQEHFRLKISLEAKR